MYVRRCPLAGCAPSPPILDTAQDYPIERLDVRGTSLVWWRRSGNQIRSCTLPACTAPVTVIAEANVLGLITDGTSIFFSRALPVGAAGGPPALYKCAANTACITPPVFTTGRVGGPTFKEHGGVLYGVDPGMTQAINDGYVWSAPAGAAGATTTFSREEIGPTDLAVDADGVFWINPTLKTVSTCPISGCVGAPRMLAQQQTGLKAIATDKQFVYWLTDTAVFKVAK
jgi:hypothetical protein